jgi:hypothetical protein
MRREQVVALVFLLFGVAILTYLSTILSLYPLFDWATNDLQWVRAWLYMSVLDYYGASICLCCIAFYSETAILAVVWSLGFLLLGSPVCCAYICYRLVIHGPLSLDSQTLPFRRLDE